MQTLRCWLCASVTPGAVRNADRLASIEEIGNGRYNRGRGELNREGKGLTLSINVHLFTDDISDQGSGYVKQRQAWSQGDIGFRPNREYALASIGDNPIMSNTPDELVDAIIIKAAGKQSVTLFLSRTKEQLTELVAAGEKGCPGVWKSRSTRATSMFGLQLLLAGAAVVEADDRKTE